MTMAHPGTSKRYSAVSQSKNNWLPSALLMAVIFISFHPFGGAAAVAGKSTGGDIVNQIGFGLIGLYCSFLLSKNLSENTKAALWHPAWIAVAVVLAISTFTADSPGSAIRSMLFSIIVVLAAITALTLPRNMHELVSALAWACIATLCFCYFAVYFVPEQGIHQAGELESQHAGLWRGVYPHKNGASYVMGVFFMIGLFICKNGRSFLGLLIAVLALIFVFNAGSKTVLGILPAAMLATVVARWVTWRTGRKFIVVFPVLALITATLGGIIFPSILDFLQKIIPGLTYTGRIDLWEFGIGYVRDHPWLGYGFESFWGTPRVENLQQPIELSWDIRNIVHGHNSWMDAAIAFGIPGALVTTFALMVLPVRDFGRIADTGNASKLATLFISIWIFTALGASLESFFFRRADPVWFCMLLAVIGLRLTAHLSGPVTPAPRHHN